MSATMVASLVTAAATIGAAVIGWYRKGKEGISASAENNEIVVANASTSDSLQAIGNNISQYSSTTHIHSYANTSPLSLAQRVETKPSPSDISEAVTTAKPFNRDRIKNNYVGVLVCWRVRFQSIRVRENEWSLDFISERAEGSSYVSTSVKPESYPRLKVIDEGHLCWIAGTISEVRAHHWVFLEEQPDLLIE